MLINVLLYSVPSLKVAGLEHQTNAVVCLHNPTDHDYPEFAKIKHIIHQEISGSQHLLLVMILTTMLHDSHYNACRVCKTSNFKFATIDCLTIMDVLSDYQVGSEDCSD